MSIIRLFSSMTAEQVASTLGDGLNSFVRSELERAFNEGLGGEVEGFLLAASSPNGERIYRNGYCERTLKASYGPLSLRVPRDRLAPFKTGMLRACQRSTNDLEHLAQRLYPEGLTLSGISGHLSSDSSAEFSRGSIRKLVAESAKKAAEFRNRALPECVVVFMDGACIPLKRSCGEQSSATKGCVEVAIGITKDGRRRALDFRAVPQKGAGNWPGFLESPKKRGIGSPKLFVINGMAGMPEAIAKSFPDAKHQPCLVHAQRNISQAVRIGDRKEIMDDFKSVCSKGPRGECDEAFSEFVSKWSKPYPRLVLSLVERQDSMFRFDGFPKAMRRSIYTPNAAESLNSVAKRKTRRGYSTIPRIRR